MSSVGLEEEWSNFKGKFNRNYGNAEEEQKRKQIFLQNKQIVDEHNAKYAKGEVTYSMAINHFSDKTPEELQGMRGGMKPSG